ncbi:MAG: GNAT family N-acetyltransferase [Pseudomonadota bacterium]
MSPFRIRPLIRHDAERMACIHQQCFPKAWPTETFYDYFDKFEWDGVFGFGIRLGQDADDSPELSGFILGRTLYDLNDILTFAIVPDQHGKGLGRALLAAYLNETSCDCMLEVATGNTAAIHLYTSFGFETIMTRRGYYDDPDPLMRDAYVMRRKGVL